MASSEAEAHAVGTPICSQCSGEVWWCYSCEGYHHEETEPTCPWRTAEPKPEPMQGPQLLSYQEQRRLYLKTGTVPAIGDERERQVLRQAE